MPIFLRHYGSMGSPRAGNLLGGVLLFFFSSQQPWEALKCGLNIPAAAQSSLVTLEVNRLNLQLLGCKPCDISFSFFLSDKTRPLVISIKFLLSGAVLFAAPTTAAHGRCLGLALPLHRPSTVLVNPELLRTADPLWDVFSFPGSQRVCRKHLAIAFAWWRLPHRPVPPPYKKVGFCPHGWVLVSLLALGDAPLGCHAVLCRLLWLCWLQGLLLLVSALDFDPFWQELGEEHGEMVTSP